MMRPRSTAPRLLLLAAVALLLVASSSLLGPTRIAPGEIFGTPPSHAYWHLRAPRTLLAAVAGAGLATGGVIFQALFRNPLATPFTLGIASGASLGAAIGFLTGVSGYYLGQVPRLSLFAFVGAMAAMALVYLMSRLRGGLDMTRLLLAGVCILYVSAAGVMLATYLANRDVTQDIVVWMMGSLAVLRPRAALEIAVVLLPILGFAIYSHRAIDLLTLGDELAASRGVEVSRTVWSCLFLISLLTAVIVSNCGPIGFVGLMVPHMARAILGVRTLPLLIGSALLGAAFLACCDGIARSVFVYELPVGVITNILGAAFFFYLLATTDTAHGASR